MHGDGFGGVRQTGEKWARAGAHMPEIAQDTFLFGRIVFTHPADYPVQQHKIDSKGIESAGMEFEPGAFILIQAIDAQY